MGGPARSWVSVICETVRFHYLFSGGGVTRKRFTVCSSALMSTGFERCSSIPASLLDFYFTENKCKLFVRINFFVFLIVFNVFSDSID